MDSRIVAGNAGGRLKTNVGHYRAINEEPIHNVSLACVKAVLPDPDEIQSIGGETSTYSGITDTPSTGIYNG